MKAWRFTGTGIPLQLADIPRPTPASGEVLIAIRAAGLCHTDVGILDDPGWLERLGPLPLTLGHEVAGIISEVGGDVTRELIGERVGLTPAGETRPGLGRDGGYAPFCTALPHDLIPIPTNVSFPQAAAGTDAGKTAWHAMVCRANVRAGEHIGVIGFGGIGQIATRIAVIRGAHVTVAEPRQELWRIASNIGADRVVSSLDDLSSPEFDSVIDFAGFGDTTRQAISAVRVNGTVVQVGLGALQATISTKELVTKHISLLGSTRGSTEDIARVYELMSEGLLDPILPEITFAEIPSGLDRLRRGQVIGRLVATYEDRDGTR